MIKKIKQKAAKIAAPKNIDIEICENKNFRSVLLPESFGGVKPPCTFGTPNGDSPEFPVSTVSI